MTYKNRFKDPLYNHTNVSISDEKFRTVIRIAIAIAIVGRAITLEREQSKKKQRTGTKKDAIRIKSDNFTRSNRENWMAT